MGTQPVSGRARQSDPPIQSAWKHLLQSRSVRILSNFLLLPLVTALISGMIIGPPSR
jgi:hypothetical protein